MFNLKDNQIQSKEVWLEKIANIKKQVEAKPEITDEKQAICLVKKSILEAFEKCVPNEKFGILFSGGIDSTLLAFLTRSKVALENFCCYASVMDYENVRQAPDLERAVSAAKKLGLNLKVVKTKLEDLENVFVSFFKKDLKILSDYKDIRELCDLILLLVPRVGSLLEITKLASELSVSRLKIYEYLEFLQGVFFIKLLPKYLKSIDRSVASGKKFY